MKTTRKPLKGLTFDDVWAALMELREYQQETSRELRASKKELDRQLKESKREVDRQLMESKKAVDLQLKETGRIVGDLGNRFGELAEHLIVPNLIEKFNALGYVFNKAGLDVQFLDQQKKPLAEADALLENGEYVMVVEIKAKLKKMDIKQHEERMEKLRRYADARHDKRKLVGAVAGAIVQNQVKERALTTGFYVITQSGDTVRIEAPEGFTPKVW
jgi:hypothetical protein